MDKLYNRAFNVGVLFTVALFSILNFISYVFAYKSYLKYRNIEIGFADVGGFPSWGFPFAWERGNYFDVIWFGNEVLNFVILALFGFVFGFLFRFIWSKVSSRRLIQNYL